MGNFFCIYLIIYIILKLLIIIYDVIDDVTGSTTGPTPVGPLVREPLPFPVLSPVQFLKPCMLGGASLSEWGTFLEPAEPTHMYCILDPNT